MTINATLINLYHICKREMWLHAHAIRMEHTSDVVYEGKLIGEESYPQRAERYTEIEISSPTGGGWEGAAKIDYYDPKLGVVHEVKKSDAKEQAHVAQVKYYLYLLRRNGIKAEYGIIEYPKLRQTERVELSDEDTKEIERWVADIQAIVAGEFCPERLVKSKCKNCSYFDFCWISEES